MYEDRLDTSHLSPLEVEVPLAAEHHQAGSGLEEGGCFQNKNEQWEDEWQKGGTTA